MKSANKAVPMKYRISVPGFSSLKKTVCIQHPLHPVQTHFYTRKFFTTKAVHVICFFFHNKSDPQNICRCSYGVLIKKTAYIYKLHDSCRAKRISVDTKSLAQKLHVYIFHTESDAIIYASAISRLAARVGPHCVRVQVNWVRRQKVCP